MVLPSRDGRNSGGSGGTIFDDSSSGWASYKREKAMPFPVVVLAIENYGRVYRLLKANVPVSLEMNVDARFTGDHEHGFDTIAEIPGTDPKLKDEVVMVGGHLDSWASGTGATDNGAGTVVAMEVMRILNALQVKPRRTIRIALWSGEEQGLYGSAGYVKQHFGFVPRSTAPDQLKLPEWLRKHTGPVELKPEQPKISGYFNVDNGTGKILGIYLQENAAIGPIFAQWIEPLKDLGVTTITMRNTGGTDHQSFDAVGIPGFQFIQDRLDYGSRTHHSNMDVYERLQAGDLAQACHGGGDLRLQRGDARPDAAAQATAPSRTGGAAQSAFEEIDAWSGRPGRKRRAGDVARALTHPYQRNPIVTGNTMVLTSLW